MAERLLVTQALDERDLLAKRIMDYIDKARLVDARKNNETNVIGARMDVEAFEQKAKSAVQQIKDLIDRFNRIDAAIVASNAATRITTSVGEFTVAGAISLRGRLRGSGTYGDKTDFEGALTQKLSRDLSMQIRLADERNRRMNTEAEGMRTAILGKDNKTRDDQPLAVVDEYVNQNTTVVVDPLGAESLVAQMKESRETLLRELDTQIKVSNATTYVEF